MAEKQERAELEVIDINDLQLVDADEFPEGFDPSEDAFEQAPPVPDGSYKVKLTLQEEETYQGWKSQSGKQEVKANVIAEIVQVVSVGDVFKEDKFEGAKMFGAVSTSIPRGKTTCTMAGLLREIKQDKKYAKLVGDIPTSKQQLIALFDKVLKAEPVLGLTSQWEAWEEQKDGGYKCVKRGMENFPRDPKAPGKFLPVIKTKSGEVNAKSKIKRWAGVDTLAALAATSKAKPPAAGPRSVTPKPTGKAAAAAVDVAEPQIIDDDENE